MTNSALTLNYKNNTIEMTSIFAKKAGIYGSKEYEMLLDARKSFPNFRVKFWFFVLRFRYDFLQQSKRLEHRSRCI